MNAAMRIAITMIGLILVSVSAHGSTISLSFERSTLFNNGLSEVGNISLTETGGGPTAFPRVEAGEFRFNVTSGNGMFGDELLGFCIDVTEALKSSGEYSIVAIEDYEPFNAIIGWIGNLYDSHYSNNFGSGGAAAAFQLALWEIIYDPASFNLNGGDFSATDSTNSFSSGHSLASTWLSSLNDVGSSNYDFFVLLPDNPTDNQAILTWKPKAVPEPGALALIALGLLLTLVARGRLQTQRV